MSFRAIVTKIWEYNGSFSGDLYREKVKDMCTVITYQLLNQWCSQGQNLKAKAKAGLIHQGQGQGLDLRGQGQGHNISRPHCDVINTAKGCAQYNLTLIK